MPLIVQTAQKNVYKGPDAFDVTRKGNTDPLGLVFAPSLAILDPVLDLRRRGQLTDQHWCDYVDAYVDEMRASHRQHRETWRRMLALPKLVLLCYCTDADQCHRRVLARVWSLCGAQDAGEVPPPPMPLFARGADHGFIGLHICGRTRAKTCKGRPGCSTTSVGLCDYPLGGPKLGKTCDLPLCGRCRVQVGPDRDYCATHHRQGPPR